MLSLITLCALITLAFGTWEDPGGVSWDGIMGFKVYTKFVQYQEALCLNAANVDAPCERTVDDDVYYGPFDDSVPHFIERRLACSQQSTVTTNYKVTACHWDGDTSDHTRVYIDSDDSEKIIITEDEKNDGTTVDDSSLHHTPAGCTSYYQVEKTVSVAAVVAAGETFAFKIKVKVDGTEIVYLSHIDVTCNSDDSDTASTAGGYTVHDEYCIENLPSDDSVSRDGEFQRVYTDNQEDGLLDFNGYSVYENYNRNTRVFLYASGSTEDDRWVLGSGDSVETATPFAQCIVWSEIDIVQHRGENFIYYGCGCTIINGLGQDEAQECTGITSMSGDALGGVWITPFGCVSGHTTIETEDVLPLFPLLPFNFNLNDTNDVMHVLAVLCTMSFLLGIFTLYVCNMTFKEKNKSYQKVRNDFKECDIVVDDDDDDDELANVLA